MVEVALACGAPAPREDASLVAQTDLLGHAGRRVVAIGGATRNPFIIGTVSTLTGLDQSIADSPGAAFGDAFLAALGTGAVQEPADARAWVRVRETVRPDAATHPGLTADHEDYVALYRAMAPLQRGRAR